ncbi:MAG: NADH-quinone oxidoreductase subunit NuoE [Candidatus Caldatribacteriota bacterium]
MIIKEIVQKYGNKRENLIQILHEIQDADPQNYISKENLIRLSEIMNIPVSDITGTASFYTMFSFQPRGKYIIRVCGSPPCHIMGAETIFEVISKELKIAKGETTSDGLFTLEETSCLGVCAVAPAIMINDNVYGYLTVERVKEILAQIRKKEGK